MKEKKTCEPRRTHVTVTRHWASIPLTSLSKCNSNKRIVSGLLFIWKGRNNLVNCWSVVVISLFFFNFPLHLFAWLLSSPLVQQRTSKNPVSLLLLFASYLSVKELFFSPHLLRVWRHLHVLLVTVATAVCFSFQSSTDFSFRTDGRFCAYLGKRKTCRRGSKLPWSGKNTWTETFSSVTYIRNSLLIPPTRCLIVTKY